MQYKNTYQNHRQIAQMPNAKCQMPNAQMPNAQMPTTDTPITGAPK